MGRPPRRVYQGFLFAYELTPRRLNLKLFRLFPLATVRLDRVTSMRRASSREFLELGWHRFFVFWKYWHWPYPLSMLFCRSQVVYLLETRRHLRIFVRLKPSFHYMLRTALGDHLAQRNEAEAARRNPDLELTSAPGSRVA